MNHRIEGEVCIHDYAYGLGKVTPNLLTDKERAALPPVRQAMVLHHGAWGRSLYIGVHMT